MKKILALVLVLSLSLSLVACAISDTCYNDEEQNAYALVTTTSGGAYTFKAFTYDAHTGYADAINNPYDLCLREGETATVHFKCTACDLDEEYEHLTAPIVLELRCNCVTGDTDHEKMTEVLFININFGSPPAEEG